jgi:hypothetical protein
LEEEVGALVWYSSLAHAVMALHSRSVVAVSALDMYCVLVSHTVRAWHSLLVEVVGATDSKVFVSAPHTVRAQH